MRNKVLSSLFARFFGLETPTIKKEDKNINNMRVGISGYKGVSKASKTNRWEAYLATTKGKIHIGTFPTVSDAYTARLKYIDSLK